MIFIKTKEELTELLKTKEISVVNFFATWCGPCKMMTPVFEKVSEELSSEINVSKINIDEAPALAEEFDVKSIPTTVFFKNGKEYSRHVGFLDFDSLIKKIKE